MNGLIKIAGSPYQCGRILGRFQRRALLDRIARTLDLRQRTGVTASETASRVRELTDMLRNVAPDWLAEVKGTADGAGVEINDILMLNCLPADFYPPSSGDCTSFVEVGPQRNRLFKIRDNRNHLQCLAVQSTDKLPALQFGRDIGNLGVAHALNRHGLAGATEDT